jgi:hypothetical protein
VVLSTNPFAAVIPGKRILQLTRLTVVLLPPAAAEWGLQAGSPGSHARASLRPRGRSLSGQLSLPEVGPSTSPAQPPDPMLWQQLLPAPMPSNGHGHLGSQGDTWGHSNGGSVISLQQSGVNGASAQGAGVDGSQPLLSGAPNGIGHDGEPHEPPPLVRVECAACHKVRFVPPDSLNQVGRYTGGEGHMIRTFGTHPACPLAAFCCFAPPTMYACAAAAAQGPAALLGPAPGWVCDMHPDPARRSCDLPQEQAPGADGLMEAVSEWELLCKAVVCRSQAAPKTPTHLPWLH